MNVVRSNWLALPFAFLLPLGCNTAAPTADAEEAPEAQPAAVAAPVAATQGSRHGHARGPAHMLFHAARALVDLTDAQRTSIDNLSAQLRGPATGANSAAHTSLVAGVRAGKVDLSVIQPLETAGRQAHAQRETTALNGLWAALEPAQRTALVASVREHQTERAASWASHSEGAGSSGGWAAKRLAHLTSQLGLDAGQQQAVQGIMASDRPSAAVMQARHAEMKSRHEALLAAFEGDAFDASKLDLAPAEEAEVGPAHHAQFLAQLVPILRADQRETLAASMEKPRN